MPVIFDFDGVIANTEALHFEASRLVAPGGSVFVHDCNRKPEAEAAALFLGEHRVFTSVSGPLGLLKGYAF